jgi:lipopolysaccharide export system protein LptC
MLFQRARRHSRFVGRARILLPLAGAISIVVLVVATSISLPEGVDLSMARMSVTKDGIVMDSPRVSGFDARNREYTVTAERAVQALNRPDAVRLEGIEATVEVAGEGSATVTAGGGDFDNAASTLNLYGGIVVESTQGYTLTLKNADIDFKAGTLVSPNPVTITQADSQTSGNRLDISESGKRVVISGNVSTTLLPPGYKRSDAPAEPTQ